MVENIRGDLYLDETGDDQNESVNDAKSVESPSKFENRWPGWKHRFDPNVYGEQAPANALNKLLTPLAKRAKEAFSSTREKVGVSSRMKSLTSAAKKRAQSLGSQIGSVNRSLWQKRDEYAVMVGIPAVLGAHYAVIYSAKATQIKWAAAEIGAAAVAGMAQKLGLDVIGRKVEKYTDLNFISLFFIGIIAALVADAALNAYTHTIHGTLPHVPGAEDFITQPDNIISGSSEVASYGPGADSIPLPSRRPSMLDSVLSSAPEPTHALPHLGVQKIAGDHNTWNLLTSGLEHTTALDETSREGFAHAFHRAMTADLQNELLGRASAPIPWDAIADGPVHFDKVLSDNEFASRLSRLIATEYHHLFDQLGGTDVAVKKFIGQLADAYRA